MYDHVYRTIIFGSFPALDGDASGSLIARLRPTGFERYTGLVVLTPELRLAVLEGPAALTTLHRHALTLAGLSAAQTLLAQRTSFRWFSALLLQNHVTAPAGFSATALAALATLPPRKLCNHIAMLAMHGESSPLRLDTPPEAASRAAGPLAKPGAGANAGTSAAA